MKEFLEFETKDRIKETGYNETHAAMAYYFSVYAPSSSLSVSLTHSIYLTNKMIK